MNTKWLERERATAECVQGCFDEFVERRHRHGANSLQAICQLTWLTGDGDNTSKVVAPALGELMNKDLHSNTHEELQDELRSMQAPERVRRALENEVGFTNFYNAYRKASQAWMSRYWRRVFLILKRARHLRSDLEARKLYAEMQVLPRILGRHGKMHVENLLTPAVACLDPRARCPIINGRDAVRERLKKLGLARGTLVEQFDGLVGLLHQGGLGDAFELDVSKAEISALSKGRSSSVSATRSKAAERSRPLGAKDAGDVRVLLKARSTNYRRLHNEMTNQLLPRLKDAGLDCDEGKDPSCRYDARVKNYDGKGRDLLLEAKAATDIQFCRMAVGQLFDYRRHLSTRARTDLAALFPYRPSADACDFLRELGIKVLWFNPSIKRIFGDVRF